MTDSPTPSEPRITCPYCDSFLPSLPRTYIERIHDAKDRLLAERLPAPEPAAPIQPLDSFLADAGLSFEDIPVAMTIHRRALAHERQQGREDAAKRVTARLIAEAMEDAIDHDDAARILRDAIASPSEEPKE